MLREIAINVLKFGISSILGAYLGYVHAPQINRTLENVRYAMVNAEEEFIPVGRAIELKKTYRVNAKGNLETYIMSYGQELPVYLRPEGIMVGDPEYLFSNLGEGEVFALCNGETEKEEVNPERRKQLESKVNMALERIFRDWDE